MTMMVADSLAAEELLKERRKRGLDKYDEVWEGMYVMHALPNDEHQKIVTRLTAALVDAIEDAGIGEVRAGINLASDPNDWQHDYRCPDAVVFLNDSTAECHGAFWTGGPALAVEVVSPDDEYRQKLDFYGKVGTQELLVVNRDPWRLELHRHDGQGLPVAAACELDGEPIASESLPLSLQLVTGDPRPRILVRHAESQREWSV